ncbi:MAG: hypothetical protein QFB87_05455 [Patescibacteria group bacterium]|nr:hypothetical protein [Patescibacteria group bacterium]
MTYQVSPLENQSLQFSLRRVLRQALIAVAFIGLLAAYGAANQSSGQTPTVKSANLSTQTPSLAP